MKLSSYRHGLRAFCLVMALLLLGLSLLSCSQNENQNEDDSENEQPPETFVAMSLDQVIADYAQDENAANDKYVDQWFSFTGYVSSFDDVSSQTLTLYKENPSVFYGTNNKPAGEVLGQIEDGQTEAQNVLNGLHKEDLVTIYGKVSHISKGGYTVSLTTPTPLRVRMVVHKIEVISPAE